MDPRDIPEKIEIEKEVGIRDLDARLRNVRLRGFPDLKIYEEADIEIKEVSPEQVKKDIFIPQPRVYRTFIDGLMRIAEMFKEQEIDIFRLTSGYDYTAFYNGGGVGRWTMIPPVIEVVPIFFNAERGLDYSRMIGPTLKEFMERRGYSLNPELLNLDFPEFARFKKNPGAHAIPLICDGSNRIHAAIEQGRSQNVLFIDGPKPGFPYYSSPKPYSTIHVEQDRESGAGSDKTHVLIEPGHKELYRLFPSGGILSGDVRPDDKK